MLLTGAGTMDRALAAINEGEVHRFLAKPFDAVLFRATMRSLFERILALRRSRDRDLRAARRGELYRWVEETFPGTLEVERNERGEVEIEPPAEDLELLDRSPPSPT
jgi:response regulator RpfG family c-di-GMP phosphodiesterase